MHVPSKTWLKKLIFLKKSIWGINLKELNCRFSFCRPSLGTHPSAISLSALIQPWLMFLGCWGFPTACLAGFPCSIHQKAKGLGNHPDVFFHILTWRQIGSGGKNRTERRVSLLRAEMLRCAIKQISFTPGICNVSQQPGEETLDMLRGTSALIWALYFPGLLFSHWKHVLGVRWNPAFANIGF